MSKISELLRRQAEEEAARQQQAEQARKKANEAYDQRVAQEKRELEARIQAEERLLAGFVSQSGTEQTLSEARQYLKTAFHLEGKENPSLEKRITDDELESFPQYQQRNYRNTRLILTLKWHAQSRSNQYVSVTHSLDGGVGIRGRNSVDISHKQWSGNSDLIVQALAAAIQDPGTSSTPSTPLDPYHQH
jgi:hypothetical protein